MSFALAKKVADAVLYEGYVLYPYRASSVKNRVRWQFGVVFPRSYGESAGEAWSMQTECLVEPDGDPVVDVQARFLQVQARTVEERVDGELYRTVESLRVEDRDLVTWDEGVEQARGRDGISLASLLKSAETIPVEIPGGSEIEDVTDAAGRVAARLRRERWPIQAVIRLEAEEAAALIKLRCRIENISPWDGTPPDRETALRHALLGTHTLLGVRGGAFVSLLDPPAALVAAAAACRNQGTWPVLVGEEASRDVMLSSPIILYDHPAVAPESPGDLCDATEIDEILSLRILTLTEEEKREACATDERARRIVERTEAMPPEVFERLHGAVRWASPRADAPAVAAVDERTDDASGARDETERAAIATSEWEEFLNPEGAPCPSKDSVTVGGILVSKGSTVTLRPRRRADAMDLFLDGRLARVEGIFRDVDGDTHVAVTLKDDPSGEMHSWFGRFFYFRDDEVEPVAPPPETTSDREKVSNERSA